VRSKHKIVLETIARIHISVVAENEEEALKKAIRKINRSVVAIHGGTVRVEFDKFKEEV
jgi:hypothetical protein